MATIALNNGEEMEIENLEAARFWLERILCAIDDGARGLDSAVNELRGIVAEYEDALKQV